MTRNLYYYNEQTIQNYTASVKQNNVWNLDIGRTTNGSYFNYKQDKIIVFSLNSDKTLSEMGFIHVDNFN